MLIVGVGASAGGQEAYTQLLKHLPPDTGMGFVLVQHLDPEHESALAQILSCATSLPVREITHNLPVQANHVYIIPRDRNLTIEQGVLKLEARERARTPHRPIDTFFKSLARDQRERAIGVVLFGTASDGTLGLEAIKAGAGSPSPRTARPSTIRCRAVPWGRAVWTSFFPQQTLHKSLRALHSIPISSGDRSPFRPARTMIARRQQLMRERM